MLSILPISSTLRAQSQHAISFNPDVEKPYQYEVQLKVSRSSSRYFNLRNKLTFSKIDKGYRLTETINKFSILSGGKLKFTLSAPFPDKSKLQKTQKLLKNIRLTRQLDKKGAPLGPWDYSFGNGSNAMNPEEKNKTTKLLGMFSRQLQPFYTNKTLTKDTEFSRRTLAPAFFQKNDSTYYRTDYSVLRKTDRTTILSYNRMPESIKKGQRQSNIQIEGMVVVENKTGMLLHRRELLKGFDLMKYQLVINRKDVQRLSFNNPYLDSSGFMADFKHYKKLPDTLNTEQIKRLYSKQNKLPDSFESKEKAKRYIYSLQPFLYYRKYRYTQSGQLLYKNIDNTPFISGHIKGLKGFNKSGEHLFTSEFSKDEHPFTVPQGTNKGVRRIPGAQFIIPDATDSVRGSLVFHTEVGTQAQKLTKRDVGKKLDLPNMHFKIIAWNDSSITYLGFGGLNFYDNNNNILLPKKATTINHYIPQLTSLLDKPADKLTHDDFLLYSNIDGFPDYLPHHTVHFGRPVAYIKLYVPEQVHPVNRTFTIDKK
ncbi:hypothetical protein [Fodinibius halophilus]|uniref:Uncharacterized protein n=1 Tax=Fodinibius halophilus TaxID=1736908 RepID=A0A6M1T3C3_9BACT|nr:hypothetical protein [Fodinibius halophilus]NGP87123.1 hypothetical protein [Fodinibius halophilus]